MKTSSKLTKRSARRRRVRARISGTSIRPRFSVFRSNRHILVQLIDDTSGRTILSSSDLELTPKSKDLKKKRKENAGVESAEKVGGLVAQKAMQNKITAVVFDRGGYKYHGLVKAVADGARKGGLKF